MLKRLLIGVLVVALVGVAGVGVLTWLGARGIAPAALEARYLTEADRFVEVDGVRFRVREEGPASGEVVVMIHGFSYSLESFDAWASALRDEFRVVRFDLPGHGLTGPDSQARYSNEQTVDLTRALLDQLGIERAHLVGNSLGGLVAWRLAAADPARVRKLVLIAPGGFSINGVDEDPVEVPPAVAVYLRFAPEALVARGVGGLYGDPGKADPATVARVRDMMRRRGVGDALIRRLEVFTLPDPTLDLARVTAPTLILWGLRDTAVPHGHGDQFLLAMPDAEVILYETLGHVPHEEDPATTVSDARAFLKADERFGLY